MKILQELFGNLATFSSYAPGVETNIDLQDLQRFRQFSSQACGNHSD